MQKTENKEKISSLTWNINKLYNTKI